jgi:hypothetical protein
MARAIRRRLTFANVVAVLALFIALGGSVYAANKISGKTIKKGSEPGNRIKKNTITGKQVKEKTLGTVPSANQVKVLSPPASGTTLRGTFSIRDVAAAGGEEIQQGLGFGFTLASAPTVHYINFGAPAPAGCAGDPATPQASAGNLCIFESTAPVNSTQRGEFNPTTDDANDNEASPYGFAVFARADAAGGYRTRGSWAVTAGG